MKNSYKPLLIMAAVVVGVVGAVSLLHGWNGWQPICAEWEGRGNGQIVHEGETYCFFEVWHAETKFISTGYDSIYGCWYDSDGHGGNFYGRRNHATDSAWGVAYANDSEDEYCAGNITGEVTPELRISWEGIWTGTCEDATKDVSCAWEAFSTGGGSFWDTTYTCVDEPPPPGHDPVCD